MGVDVSAVRAGLKAALVAVPNIGQVHDYERYAKNERDLAAHYAYGGAIRGWYIRRAGATESMTATRRNSARLRWRITGFMSIDDGAASEITFDGLIEAVRDQVRADPSLGGAADGIVEGNQAGVQLDDAGPVLFAGVLCHSARMSLITRHNFTT
jgi:hypothetical protein